MKLQARSYTLKILRRRKIENYVGKMVKKINTEACRIFTYQYMVA